MLDDYLNYIQEINTSSQKIPGSAIFGKITGGLNNGNYVLFIDNKKKIDQNRGQFNTLLRFGMPIAVVFDKTSDIKKLTKVNTSVNTKIFYGMKAQKIFQSMKIISKGTCTFEAYSATVIIRKLQLSPFNNNAIIVIRSDPYWATQKSITTREIPVNVYFRTKNSKKLEEAFKENTNPVFKHMLISLAITISMLFGSLAFFIALCKRNKKLERNLNNVLKDGRQWRVYVIRDSTPNAFCLATPKIFLHSGLIQKLNEKEVMAIMLHEVGHIQNRDAWKHIFADNAFMLMIIGIVSTSPAAPIVIPMVYFLLMMAKNYGLIDTIFAMTLDRRAEKHADTTASKYGYGKELISALQKIDKWVKKQQSKRPCGKVCKLVNKINEVFDEHPPVKKRVENILKDQETWKPANFRITTAKKFWIKKLTPKG